MSPSQEMNARDAKLVQWLSEAHVKEAELEADLTAHIALTRKQSYKKRLQQHLKETRDHKKRVAARIKKLGGTPQAPSLPGVPGAVGEVAGKAVAAVKGQVGVARAAVTETAETHLRNAQEELREEHVEIAIYTRIETLSSEVGDRETAQLAKGIRRDEERMAKFLGAELKRLVKDVVKAEIPRDQRAARARRSTKRRSSSSSSKSGSGSAAASRASSSGRSATAGSRATKSSTSSSRAKSRSAGAKTSRARGSASGSKGTGSRGGRTS